jgi:phosphoribosylamine--glycine ligase
MIVGHGGRESALAFRMAEHSQLYAFAGHLNPSLARYADASAGKVQIGDVCDAQAVAAFARANHVDLAMVSADEPLEAGVVDALLAQGTPTVGPTRAGAEIEWNKEVARALLLDVAPEATPRLRVVHRAEEVDDAIASFGSAPIVVKPSGLTGGKGVKVMGPHLASHQEARDYALSLLAGGGAGDSVLIEQKIVGAEFTIQAISDGRTVVFPNSTYDYPYRFDGDEGPGTGGMGSLSTAQATLPFMSPEHYAQACSIVERVIARLADEGRRFTGVMNSGFFATDAGVQVIEFNARFCAGELTREDVRLRDEASLVLYLVSPDYALPSGAAAPTSYEFDLDVAAIERAGASVFFSSAVHVAGDTYRTVGTSRAVALVTTAPNLPEAHERIVHIADSVDVLQWRRDVGDELYLRGLSRHVRSA